MIFSHFKNADQTEEKIGYQLKYLVRFIVFCYAHKLAVFPLADGKIKCCCTSWWFETKLCIQWSGKSI